MEKKNFEDDKILLPPLGLERLMEEMVEIEQVLEEFQEFPFRHVSMEKPSIASTPLPEIGKDFVSVDAVFHRVIFISKLKKRREAALKKVAGFLRNFSSYWLEIKNRGYRVDPQSGHEVGLAANEGAAAVIRKLAENRIRDEENALGAKEVARFLGSRSSTNLRQLALEHRKRGDLLGVKVSGKFLYPAFQFDEARQEVYPVVKEINKILSSESDPWAVFDWWVSPNARLVGDMAPKELLSNPEKHSTLRSLAEAVIEDAG